MGSYSFDRKFQIVNLPDGSDKANYTPRTTLDNFTVEVLGLGQISQRAKQIDAIVAMFDLEGFTNFCTQIDPYLTLPEYLNSFLDWLFEKIRSTSINERDENGYFLYHEPPMLAKFMGDGVMFLWNTEQMSEVGICNVVTAMSDICDDYTREFLPTIRMKIKSAPPKLRCGVARGHVCSVGNGEDYVGAAINVAARLQKLGSLRFAFSRRGFNYEEQMPPSTAEYFVTKKVDIRGIGEGELVCIYKSEFEKLSSEEKKMFQNE